jgi:hypothetical protein
MWLWGTIFLVVAVAAVVVIVVDRRRGASGSGEGVDFTAGSRVSEQQKSQWNGPFSGGGGGGDGGG